MKAVWATVVSLQTKVVKSDGGGGEAKMARERERQEW